MGATVVGDTIYISKDLSEKMTPAERKVLLAHEVYHWQHRDNLRFISAQILFFWCPPLFNYISRRIETQADKYSIKKTRDVDSFITLMEKLEHNNKRHPSKIERQQLAESMRGKI